MVCKYMKENLVYAKFNRDNFNEIICMDNSKIVGFLIYRIHNSTAWLNKIKVEKDYRCCGIGKTLLNLFENDCINSYRKYIEGKFYPEDEDGYIVKNFYEHNGYSVEKDGYETMIFKNLNNTPLHNTDDINIMDNLILDDAM